MKYDLLIHQGATLKKELPIDEDFSDYTVRMQVRKHPSKDEILLEIFPDIINNNIVVELSPEDTSVDWTEGVYDVEITSPDQSDIQFPYFGSIKIRPRVTR